MVVDYDTYHNFVGSIQTIFNFKGDHRYSYMLEHVSKEQGQQYYNLLKDECKIDKKVIESFCSLNDAFGSPVRHSIYDLSFPVSPTSLRYLYHACLILDHFKKYSPIHIVEVGGGYGGLCLAISHMSFYKYTPVASYTIIDLTNIIRLQDMYLNNFKLRFPLKLFDANNYGKELTESTYCLVSNYCFSEISSEHQQKYLEVLFPKVSHGFLTWNFIPVFDIGKKDVKIEDERPMTGSLNKFVYF